MTLVGRQAAVASPLLLTYQNVIPLDLAPLLPKRLKASSGPGLLYYPVAFLAGIPGDRW